MWTGISAETPKEQSTCVDFDDDKKAQPPKAHEPQPPPAGDKKTPLIPRPPGRMIFKYTLDSYVPVQQKEWMAKQNGYTVLTIFSSW